MRHDPGKLEEILRCALRDFLARGVRKTSLRDLAAEVGLSTQMFGIYAKDKTDLVRACADRYHRAHVNESKKIIESHLDPLAKLKVYLLNRFYAWREIHLETPQSTELAAVLLRVGAKSIENDEDLFTKTIEKILRKGVDTRHFRIENPEREAHYACMCLKTCFPMAGLRRPRQPGEKELIEIIDWLSARWRRK